MRLHSRVALLHFISMRFDPTSERWRYDARLFLLAYIFGVIAFSAVIPG
jgi:hypothetical protein